MYIKSLSFKYGQLTDQYEYVDQQKDANVRYILDLRDTNI